MGADFVDGPACTLNVGALCYVPQSMKLAIIPALLFTACGADPCADGILAFDALTLSPGDEVQTVDLAVSGPVGHVEIEADLLATDPGGRIDGFVVFEDGPSQVASGFEHVVAGGTLEHASAAGDLAVPTYSRAFAHLSWLFGASTGTVDVSDVRVRICAP